MSERGLLLMLVILSSCGPTYPPPALIASACDVGQRGCLGAYKPYEVLPVTAIRPVESSQPGLRVLRPGDEAVCE